MLNLQQVSALARMGPGNKPAIRWSFLLQIQNVAVRTAFDPEAELRVLSLIVANGPAAVGPMPVSGSTEAVRHALGGPKCRLHLRDGSFA